MFAHGRHSSCENPKFQCKTHQLYVIGIFANDRNHPKHFYTKLGLWNAHFPCCIALCNPQIIVKSSKSPNLGPENSKPNFLSSYMIPQNHFSELKSARNEEITMNTFEMHIRFFFRLEIVSEVYILKKVFFLQNICLLWASTLY